jgi:hypothetical protein
MDIPHFTFAHLLSSLKRNDFCGDRKEVFVSVYPLPDSLSPSPTYRLSINIVWSDDDSISSNEELVNNKGESDYLLH